MAYRYKIGTYDAEGSFFREFERDDLLSPEALHALVFDALAEVAAADKAKYEEMLSRRAEAGKDVGLFDPWNESLGQLVYGDNFRDALLARGFREVHYDGEVRLHGWSHALGGGPCDRDEANADTRAAQAALRAAFGPAPSEDEA